MKKYFVFLVFIMFSTVLVAENYLINGGQASKINYSMEQQIVPNSNTNKLILSYVEPVTFRTPTFNQTISNFNLNFSIKPDNLESSVDKRGNKIKTATWKKPNRPINAVISFTATNETRLKMIKTSASFPPAGLPTDVKAYLSSTDQVPTNDPAIVQKAKQITAGSKNEFDAVQKILTWVIDHMNYVLMPQSYEAMYSFKTGKGNCQNYSHLSAALMRAVGIPCRIVNGITLKQPYTVKTSNGNINMRMAEGRHSWIEVYFPDLNWVAFDPQQTNMYVSNRFIRVEVGLDNNETANDGLIRWAQSRGTNGTPEFQEVISANFVGDNVNLVAEKQNWGPRKSMFTPQVQAVFTKPTVKKEPEPQPIPPKTLNTYNYERPFIYGNLEYPENIAFITTRGPAVQTGSGQLEMRKNFLVETAEYVTTRGDQYAQTFVLKKPLKLVNVGLALRKFGGDGQLWIELYKDDGKGRPGEYITTSEYLPLNSVKQAAGYSWVDFSFKESSPTLSPGRYWLALGFTGSPIVNWFYTYGKPVGPADGTRFKTLFDETWSNSLNYEFNYRVLGYVPR